MTTITNITQARKGKKKQSLAEREDRLLDVLDELVHAFWAEGVRLNNVTIQWTGGEDYIREARGEQR